MNMWEKDLTRNAGVLGREPNLASINKRHIEALNASVVAGVPDEASFREALRAAGVCVTQVQLDGAVDRAKRRAAGESIGWVDPQTVPS